MNSPYWTTKSILILFIFLTTWSYALLCQQGCSCNGDKKYYECKHSKLASPPDDLPQSMDLLLIEDNPGLDISLNFFNNISITSLVLVKNEIDHYFRLPLKIEELNLEGNKINFSTLVKFMTEDIPIKPPYAVHRNTPLVCSPHKRRPDLGMIYAQSTQDITHPLFDNSWPDVGSILERRQAMLRTQSIKGRVSQLKILNLKNNDITIFKVDKPLFQNTKRLRSLYLSLNNIPYITEKLFSGLRDLEILHLRKCNVQHIHEKAFVDLESMTELQLGENAIKSLPYDLCLPKSIVAWNLNVSYNNVTIQPSARLSYWDYIDYSYNSIKTIAGLVDRSFKAGVLNLRGNQLTNIRMIGYSAATLDLAFNNLTRIENDSLPHGGSLTYLDISNNNIHYIHPRAFWKLPLIKYIFAQNNKITSLSLGIFPRMLNVITLYNNNIQNISTDERSTGPFGTSFHVDCSKLYFVNITTKSTGEVKCGKTYWMDLYTVPSHFAKTLSTRGYQCIDTHINMWQKSSKCITCDIGYFNNGQKKCQPCPRGGYYQDEKAQSSCKKCHPGLFTNTKAANSSLDCKVCPPGTDSTRFAETRACYCLPSFSRRKRFGPCNKCTKYGIRCTKDTKDLVPEYWWKWSNKTDLDQFLCFKDNIANEGKDYNISCNSYSGKLPQVYKCPFRNACLGGISSNCHKNYTGPLCAICSRNFYNTYLGCLKCPKNSASILKLLIAPLLILLVALVLRWMDTVIMDNNSKRTLADMFLSLTKIVLGYYQILAVIIRILSDIQWPKIMITFSSSFYQVALEVFSFPALKCIHPKLEISAYTEMVVSCSIVIIVPILLVLVYDLHSCIRKLKACAQQIGNESCRLKKLYIRGLLMFYFVVYPAVCQRIFQVMPFNCHQVCLDQGGRICQSYLRVDYRVQCPPTNPSNNTYVYIAYAALIIPCGFPLMLLIMLWYSHKQLENGNQWNIEENVVVFATRFCYENYKSTCWYWEVVEMMRKLLFTIGFAFFGLGSRSNLGCMIIISGSAIISYAYNKPIKYKMEHAFHMISLSCLFLTLCVGSLLRIKEKYMENIYDPMIDKLGISIIVVLLNLAPIVSILVHVIYSLVSMIHYKIVNK